MTLRIPQPEHPGLILKTGYSGISSGSDSTLKHCGIRYCSRAGELDSAMGGPPIDLFKQPFTTRRSVYGFY
jgi:hypothetical protein